jgi:hypothetical protein
MTECKGGPAEEFAERYLAGTLSEMESQSFEEHYFACAVCHEWLQALEDIQGELSREPVAIPAKPPRRLISIPVPMRVVAWGSLAAVLLIGVIVAGVSMRRTRTGANLASTAPSGKATGVAPEAKGAAPSGAVQTAGNSEVASLEKLADLSIPHYQEPQLRGAEGEVPGHSEFAAGMHGYAQGNCRGALTHLAQVPAGAADAVPARLFAGLCQFDQHHWKLAQASFKSVAAAGDSPQLETAEYYLAQTALEMDDLAGAKAHLAKTIALRGDYEDKAKAQLARLREAQAKR